MSMSASHTRGPIYVESINPGAPLPPKMLASMARRRELRRKAFEERLAGNELLKSTDDERELRSLIRAELLTKINPAKSLDLLRQQRAARFNKVREHYQHLTQFTPRPLGLDPKPLDQNGIGTLWWASTSVSWSTPTAGAFVPFFQDGLLRFGGDIEVQSEDLQYASMHVFAQFGLGADRMPAGSNFVSSPFINLFGEVDGGVLPGVFDFGDQWSKCWLNTAQSVLTPVTFGGVPSNAVLGTNSQTTTLIFIESNFSIDFQRYSFPGFFGLPPVSFFLYDFARSDGIEIDLDIHFDMQLVGDQSSLIFRADGGTDSGLESPLPSCDTIHGREHRR